MKRSTRYILASVGVLALIVWAAFALPSCTFDTSATWTHKQPGVVLVGTKPDPKDADAD